MSKSKKKIPKVKEPIALRTKELLNGNKSLYLDIYRGGGKREYDFLKLYLIPENCCVMKLRCVYHSFLILISQRYEKFCKQQFLTLF